MLNIECNFETSNLRTDIETGLESEIIFLMQATDRPESEVRDFLNMRDFNELLAEEAFSK